MQGFVHAHGGQQPGKALRQHGFARAGWPHHQQAVAAGGGDFQRALGCRLAFHVGQVGVGACGKRRAARHARPALRRRPIWRHGQKLLHHVQQVARALHLGAGHQGGFFGAGGRQHQARHGLALGVQRQAHCQRTAHRPQLARQRQLACKFVSGQLARIDLAAGRQDAQGDRQVKPFGASLTVSW